MTSHNAAAGRFITSKPITSAQMWLIVAWILFGRELVLQLGRAAGAEGTAAKNALQLGSYGVIVLWVLWLRRRNGLDVAGLFGPPPTRLSRLIPVLAGPSLALVWAGLLTSVMHAQVVQAGQTSPPLAPEDVLDWRHPASALIRLGILVVIGPAVEELLFRGVLLNRLTRTLGASAPGVLTTLLFAAGHVRFLPAFCLAVLMTTLYRRTGNLWIAIGAHGLHNALIVAWAAAVAWQIAPDTARAAWPGVLWIARAALLAGVIGLVLVFRPQALRAASAQPRAHEEASIS